VSSWFQTLIENRREDPTQSVVLELMVLEGADAGQQFTVDGAEVLIGRGKPTVGRTGAIFLHDRTISSRQAMIYTTPDGWILEHCTGARNPSRVNGKPISRRAIELGDRIQMGRVVMEVRTRQGLALGALLQASTTDTESADATRSRGLVTTRTELRAPPEESTTDVRERAVRRASLTLVRGLPELEGKRFPIQADATTLGRSIQSDVRILEAGISRLHAELVWEEGELVLLQRSATNSTSVNGVPVLSRQVIESGDEILLADQVALRLELEAPPLESGEIEETPTPLPPSRRRSLKEEMEEKLERDRRIEEEFSATGSFMDIDVVGSYRMKQEAPRPAHIIVAFERFRAFVERTVTEFEGQVLNSNGDELMCFFDSTLLSVRAASQILARLDVFNLNENVLPMPFRFRIGIHTGTSLVDRERGVAYSPVLDIAGHLQKLAETNGLLISRDTLEALPEGLPFASAGMLENERIPIYRLSALIE